MKQCNRCNETKPLDMYYRNSKNKIDGRQNLCKACKKHLYDDERNTRVNKLRMYVNGKYIPNTHPLYKPGRYKAFDDVWSHVELDTRTTEGEVYIIANKAFPNWYKVGKAVSAEDRLNGYQTSSPHRDYELLYAVKFDNRHKAEVEVHKLLRNVLSDEHCQNEWFKADYEVIKDMIDVVKNTEPQLDLFGEAV